MFNNDAINVVLGLIFVFLIYSLLASIIMESVARKMGLRARMLLKAISKILDDSDFEKENFFFRAFYSLFETKYFKPFKDRSFTALFYSHPTIINLGKNSFSSKPSYISDEIFAETVVQILRGDQFDGKQNQMALIRGNVQSHTGGGGKIPIPAYYKTRTEVAKPYTLLSAADELKEGDTCFIRIHRHTYYQLQQTIFDSHNDIEDFKVRLKKLFNETVQRAEGWYIRQTRTVLFYIGLFLAILFNVNAISITQRLSTDKDLRNKVVEMAAAFNNNSAVDSTEAQKVFAKAVNDAKSLNNVLSAKREDFPRWEGNILVFLQKATLHCAGWILTAIAISLGAPFWFDLLKRIMAIRTAGDKPQETETGKIGATKTGEKIVG